MRKNTEAVFNAWRNGVRYKRENSIWTDGIHIYSYNTHILVTPDSADMPYRFNTNRYSKTTSCHQNGLRMLIEENKLVYTQHGV